MAETTTSRKKTTRSKATADTAQAPETSTDDVDAEQDQDNTGTTPQELEKQADAGPNDDDADPSTDEDDSVPAHVTALADGVATITAVNLGDSPEIARLLLASAEFPAQVRTVTAPHGWVVPEPVAKKTGLA